MYIYINKYVYIKNNTYIYVICMYIKILYMYLWKIQYEIWTIIQCTTKKKQNMIEYVYIVEHK